MIKKKYWRSYISQKGAAARRRIIWELTYEQWINWWGNDIVNRGRSKYDLCMCRFNDIGPYNINNIYKATMSQNAKDKTMSDETKAKISAAHKGKPKSAAHIANLIGKKHTDETKAKISAAHKGKFLSDETKAKMSAANLGRKHTPETRAKVSAALKGRVVTDETRAKMSAAATGRKHTAETRAKMSASHKRKVSL